jgi:monofunctional biosynthetic peptidoglycan transglycosylase
MASRKPKPKGLFARIVGGLFKTLFVLVLLSIVWVVVYAVVPPPITFTQVGDLVDGRGVTKDWTPIERIDRDMVRAAIAAEDGKFCAHNGFDTDAIADAMRRNAEGGRIRGGSTISQQTAKNAFLWQGGGYFRKGLEAWFTLLIEWIWGKQRIMEVYLNIAETGIGTYGVEAGAQRYFKKSAASLTRSEAARIAAVLPLPKSREAVAPGGFTRRYGNSIAARIPVVARDGLDACITGAAGASPAEPKAAPRAKAKPAPAPERVEDYIDPADQPAPNEETIVIDIPPPVAEEGPAAPEVNGM